MAGLAYNRLHRQGFTPRISRGCAQQIPYTSGSFQQIVTTFPSEYILDRRTIEESYRVLSPGGTFLILPMVWITGRGWIDRLASWLFRITGQSGDWQEEMLVPFQQAGFRTQVEWVEKSHWTLVIILAGKPA
jgi:ubiquinone/menaquinone biosynthesis C-methylase UbiE